MENGDAAAVRSTAPPALFATQSAERGKKSDVRLAFGGTHLYDTENAAEWSQLRGGWFLVVKQRLALEGMGLTGHSDAQSELV